MRRNATSLVLVIAFALAHQQHATAQIKFAAPPGFGIGATVGFASFSETIDERVGGVSVEGSLRYTLPMGVQIVGGVGYSNVDIENNDNNADVLAIFLDPRIVLTMDRPGAIAPFMGARLAYLDESVDTESGSASSTGWLAAGIFGLLIPISPRLAAETTLVFGYAGLGDLEVGGTTIPDSDNNGATFSIKAGLVFSFPRRVQPLD